MDVCDARAAQVPGVHDSGYGVSFLSLGAIAALAFVLLWTAVPEILQGREGVDIRVVIGEPEERERAERDQDNALEAWPEHGLLGTQLGPNKNGKKW